MTTPSTAAPTARPASAAPLGAATGAATALVWLGVAGPVALALSTTTFGSSQSTSGGRAGMLLLGGGALLTVLGPDRSGTLRATPAARPIRATMPAMVLEIADIKVKPEDADGFADAVREGIRYVSDTPGFRGARLTRGVETPTRFVLLIEWDSVEAHNVGFRESENFGRWRGVIGPFLDGSPHVEHVDEISL